MWQSWRCEPMECWHCMFPSCIRYASICVYIVLCAVLPTDIRHIHVCLLIRCRVHMAYGIRRNTANRRIAAYSRHILHVCCVCIQNVALHIARRCACSFAAILSSCFRLMAILVVSLLCVWPTRLMTSQQFFFSYCSSLFDWLCCESNRLVCNLNDCIMYLMFILWTDVRTMVSDTSYMSLWCTASYWHCVVLFQGFVGRQYQYQ